MRINSTIVNSYLSTMKRLQKETIKQLCQQYGTDQVISTFKQLLGDQKLQTTLLQNSLYAIKVKLLLQKGHVNYVCHI